MDGAGYITVTAPKNMTSNAGENMNINVGKDMFTSVGNNQDLKVTKDFMSSKEFGLFFREYFQFLKLLNKAD